MIYKVGGINKVLRWGLLLLMVSIVLGCGHRSSHSVHHLSPKFPKQVVAENGAKSKMDGVVNSSKENGFDNQGYFSGKEGNFSDLLKDEPLVLEDSSSDNKRMVSNPSNEYWVNRTRAENITAQAGLQDVHFEFNSAQLTQEAKEVLSTNAEWIKAHPDALITIEGHCDDRGTQAYNYVLGEKRAVRAKTYLASLGVDVEQLRTMTFGKDNPSCWDATESCYYKNRRAHLVLGISIASTAMHIP